MKRIKRLVKFLLGHKGKLLIILLVLAIFFSFKLFRPQKETSFKTGSVINKDIVSRVTSSGTITAKTQAVLHFQTAGKLIWLGVSKGDKVSKWQAVAKLDSRDVEKNLIKALRDYSKERNDFEEDNRDTYRFVALNDTIKRILEKNQWDLEKSVLDVEIKSLAIELSLLYSPIEGIVTSSEMSVAGVNILSSNDITITDTNSVYFLGEVDELDISNIQLDQKATITLDSYPDEEFPATVINIGFTAVTTDAGGTAFTVELSLPDNQELKFKPGMNGDAQIDLQTKTAVLTVPGESVFEEDGKNFVYLYQNNLPLKQEVNIGLEGNDDIEIISGLKEGQQVILNPAEVKTK